MKLTLTVLFVALAFGQVSCSKHTRLSAEINRSAKVENERPKDLEDAFERVSERIA